ncbi:unnamed protein product [Trichogramma brassicae]|uniref:Uncharacterized protein n=1 Tax=Trichogramma brassicae TaxID=86971 RepID=A0A6H5J3U0_9HYME|nr:unnamed protein product [Trichogramma brassicae]
MGRSRKSKSRKEKDRLADEIARLVERRLKRKRRNDYTSSSDESSRSRDSLPERKKRRHIGVTGTKGSRDRSNSSLQDDPPDVNTEVKSAVNESCRNRDQRIVHKQEKLNACMGALAGALTTLLTRKNDDDLLMIEALSDASRLLVDTIHDESAIRRSLILANVNPSLKDTLATTEIDGQLFGKNLSEVMKQAQATGKDVRTLAKKNAIPTNVSEKASKNEKGPSRHLSRKQTRTSNGQRPAAAARDHPRRNDKERPTTQRNKSSYTRSSTKKH